MSTNNGKLEVALKQGQNEFRLKPKSKVSGAAHSELKASPNQIIAEWRQGAALFRKFAEAQGVRHG